MNLPPPGRVQGQEDAYKEDHVHTATALAPTAPHSVRPGVPVAKIAIAWAKVLGGVAILAVLLWRVGTGPFLDGLRLIDGWALVAALFIGALTTVCCAWRWSIVADGLGDVVEVGGALKILEINSGVMMEALGREHPDLVYAAYSAALDKVFLNPSSRP